VQPEPLFLRDPTNKIMDAKELKWDCSMPERPKLHSASNHPTRGSGLKSILSSLLLSRRAALAQMTRYKDRQSAEAIEREFPPVTIASEKLR
jgi:hypothetical protein